MGVTPIPPARNTAVLAGLLCKVRLPPGPAILTSVFKGNVASSRLKSVSRIRESPPCSVSSCRALAIENPRTLPSASVSAGLSSVMSIHCPALKIKFAGFSNWKACALGNRKTILQVSFTK